MNLRRRKKAGRYYPASNPPSGMAAAASNGDLPWKREVRKGMQPEPEGSNLAHGARKQAKEKPIHITSLWRSGRDRKTSLHLGGGKSSWLALGWGLISKKKTEREIRFCATKR